MEEDELEAARVSMMEGLLRYTCHPVVSDAFRDNNIAAAAWFFPHT
jgi:hypothetical protein